MPIFHGKNIGMVCPDGMSVAMIVCIGERRLTTETVKGTALALQGVDHIERSD
jgi:hypothetical protein